MESTQMTEEELAEFRAFQAAKAAGQIKKSVNEQVAEWNELKKQHDKLTAQLAGIAAKADEIRIDLKADYGIEVPAVGRQIAGATQPATTQPAPTYVERETASPEAIADVASREGEVREPYYPTPQRPVDIQVGNTTSIDQLRKDALGGGGDQASFAQSIAQTMQLLRGSIGG